VGGKSKIKVQKSKLQSKNVKGRQSRGAGLVLWWILEVRFWAVTGGSRKENLQKRADRGPKRVKTRQK